MIKHSTENKAKDGVDRLFCHYFTGPAHLRSEGLYVAPGDVCSQIGTYLVLCKGIAEKNIPIKMIV